MSVTQHAPENTFTATGFGITVVVCDGQWHDGAVSVPSNPGSFFDVGRATAVGNLFATSGNATETKEIEIRL
jgi:hypothetical protein